MRMINLTDSQIDKISSEWTKLPQDIKDKYMNVHFNLVDKGKITDQGYNMVMNLIKKNNPEAFPEPEKEDNIQYVNYNEGQFKWMDKLYSMNKKQDFITKLINQAKKRGKLTQQQDYFLKYYLKNGDTPYSHKLLPNNY